MRIVQNNIDTVIENVEDFNIEQTLECGQCFHFEKIDDMEYAVVSGQHFLHIKQNGDKLTFYNKQKEEVENYWIHYFDLDRDYSYIKAQLLEKDNVLKEMIDEMYGIRILNQEFEETLMSFIISQNKQIPHIKQIVKILSEKYGEPTQEVNGKAFYTFPSGEKLYSITEEEFRECKTGFRAKYLYDAVTNITDRGLSKDYFADMDIEAAKETLMQIKGVGEKVANCVLLFGLGYREAFPVDVWMKRIMEELYFETDTSKEEIMKFASERFGKYGGYAQQYLFHYGRKHNIGK